MIDNDSNNSLFINIIVISYDILGILGISICHTFKSIVMSFAVAFDTE